MTKQTLREASRTEFSTRNEMVNSDEITNGALQRIADAVEKMAQRHTELIDQRDRFERLYRLELDRREHAERRIVALRGVISKMKKETK